MKNKIVKGFAMFLTMVAILILIGAFLQGTFVAYKWENADKILFVFGVVIAGLMSAMISDLSKD